MVGAFFAGFDFFASGMYSAQGLDQHIPVVMLAILTIVVIFCLRLTAVAAGDRRVVVEGMVVSLVHLHV